MVLVAVVAVVGAAVWLPPTLQRAQRAQVGDAPGGTDASKRRAKDPKQGQDQQEETRTASEATPPADSDAVVVESTTETASLSLTRCRQRPSDTPDTWIYGGSTLLAATANNRFVLFRSDYDTFGGLYLYDAVKKKTSALPDIEGEATIDAKGARLLWLTPGERPGELHLHEYDRAADGSVVSTINVPQAIGAASYARLQHTPHLSVSEDGQLLFFPWRRGLNNVIGLVYHINDGILTAATAAPPSPLRDGERFVRFVGSAGVTYGLRQGADDRFAYPAFSETLFSADGARAFSTDQQGKVRMNGVEIAKGRVLSVSADGGAITIAAGNGSAIIFDVNERLAQRIDCADAIISGNAATVVCTTDTAHDAADTNGTTDVYSYDRAAQSWTLLSKSPSGEIGTCAAMQVTTEDADVADDDDTKSGKKKR